MPATQFEYPILTALFVGGLAAGPVLHATFCLCRLALRFALLDPLSDLLSAWSTPTTSSSPLLLSA